MKYIPIIVLLIFVMSCSSSTPPMPTSGDSQTELAPTQLIQPTAEIPTITSTQIPNTPTSIPIADIVISPDIFRPEDLGLLRGELLDFNPRAWQLRDVVLGENNLTHLFINSDGDDAYGIVSIFLYESSEAVNNAYEQTKKNIENNSSAQIINVEFGEQSVAFEEYDDGIVYTNGSTFVFVSFRDLDLDSIKVYTKSLDKRLQEALGSYYCGKCDK